MSDGGLQTKCGSWVLAIDGLADRRLVAGASNPQACRQQKDSEGLCCVFSGPKFCTMHWSNQYWCCIQSLKHKLKCSSQWSVSYRTNCRPLQTQSGAMQVLWRMAVPSPTAQPECTKGQSCGGWAGKHDGVSSKNMRAENCITKHNRYVRYTKSASWTHDRAIQQI